MAKQGYRIMDSDTHVMEPVDRWSQYLEPDYRERAPRIEKIRDGHGSWDNCARLYGLD